MSKAVRTIKKPKSVYIWEIKEGWGISTDLREALEKGDSVRTATKEDVEFMVMMGNINPYDEELDLVMLNDGIYIYIEGEFINGFEDDDFYSQYVKIADGNPSEDKLSVEDFVDICKQIKENGKLDVVMRNTLRFCKFNDEQMKVVMDFVEYLNSDDVLGLPHDNWFNFP